MPPVPVKELDMGNDVNFLSFIALGVVLQVLDQCLARLKELRKWVRCEVDERVAAATREVRSQIRQAGLLLESLREIAPAKEPLNAEVADELNELTHLLAEVARTGTVAEKDVEFVVEVTTAARSVNDLVERHLSLT